MNVIASNHDKKNLLYNLTLVLGGTRSGKSAWAERWVRAQEQHLNQDSSVRPHVLYVATAESRSDDTAMQERIRQHRERRPSHWHTLECPLNLAESLRDILGTETGTLKPALVMVDCVTLWVSNMLFSLTDPEGLCAPEDMRVFEEKITAEITALTALIARSSCQWILVSGETGLGLVAPTAIGRQYCDGLGLANQLLASFAHEVILMVAGRALSLPPD